MGCVQQAEHITERQDEFLKIWQWEKWKGYCLGSNWAH